MIKGNLRKKEIIWDSTSRGEFIKDVEKWQQPAREETMKGTRMSELEAGQSDRLPNPFPTDILPPARMHVLKIL